MYITAIGFKDYRDLVAKALLDLAVEAVVRGVEQSIFEPLVKRRVALVECLRKRFFPANFLASVLCPELCIALVGLVTHRLISSHAAESCLCREFFWRLKNAAFLHYRFNCHASCSPLVFLTG